MLEIDTGLNGHLFSQKKIFVFPVALVLNTNTPKKKERAEGNEGEGGIQEERREWIESEK